MAGGFRKKLDDAEGVSKQVIVVNVAIRGFTNFCHTVESRQIGIHLVRIYSKRIDKHFHDAEFVKPTGDGLLVVFDYEDSESSRKGPEGSGALPQDSGLVRLRMRP